MKSSREGKLFYEFKHSIEGSTLRVCPDDDAAIAYALRTARGGALEVWRGTKLVATVDERAPLERELAA